MMDYAPADVEGAMNPLWMYVLLLVTVLIQEEAAPLAGGLAAHHGHADLPLIIAACAVGAWMGDLVLFGIGRRGGRLARHLPAARGLGVLRRHPRAAPLLIRFAYGMRWSLPVAAGASGIPLRSYAPWAAASAVIWSALYASIGWGAGALAMRIFTDIKHYEAPLIVTIALAWLIIVLHLRARHARSGPGVGAAA
jgi:membrane-associated protein